jgi:hypothetical protein
LIPLLSPTVLCQDGLTFGGAARATVPNTALAQIGTGDFTLEAWIQGNDAVQPQHPRILSSYGGAGESLLFFLHDLWGGSQHRMLALRLGAVNYLFIDNGTLQGGLLDGTCHHVAIVRENDSLLFYADDLLLGEREITGAPSVAFAEPSLYIGNDGSSGHGFNGNISEVRIWNYARSEAEILAAAHLAISGASPGLLNYWKLNEGIGQVVQDATGEPDGYLGTTIAADGSDPTWTSDICAVSGVGVAEAPVLNTITVQADRASGQLLLTALPIGSEVRISDALGRTVLPTVRSMNDRYALPITALTPGVYLATLRNGESTRTVRFLKEW